MLTREEILNEPVGRRLDEWVAEKVMGGVKKSLKTFAPKDREYWEFSESNQPWVEDWKPSSDISAAWEVVEKMKDKGWGITIQAWGDSQVEVMEFEVIFGYVEGPNKVSGKAPEAISKAAILALIES